MVESKGGMLFIIALTVFMQRVKILCWFCGGVGYVYRTRVYLRGKNMEGNLSCFVVVNEVLCFLIKKMELLGKLKK